jgi:hypothetical protein
MWILCLGLASRAGSVLSWIVDMSILISARLVAFHSCCFIGRSYVSIFKAGIDVALNAPPTCIIRAAFAWILLSEVISSFV